MGILQFQYMWQQQQQQRTSCEGDVASGETEATADGNPIIPKYVNDNNNVHHTKVTKQHLLRN